MSSQTGYDVNNSIPDQIGFGAGVVIFDSETDGYPPAPAMRFQVVPGVTESCYIHIDGFHMKTDPLDPATWDKTIVRWDVPVDIVFRNPTNPSMGYIAKVTAWSNDGSAGLNWTPLVRY